MYLASHHTIKSFLGSHRNVKKCIGVLKICVLTSLLSYLGIESEVFGVIIFSIGPKINEINIREVLK